MLTVRCELDIDVLALELYELEVTELGRVSALDEPLLQPAASEAKTNGRALNTSRRLGFT